VQHLPEGKKRRKEIKNFIRWNEMQTLSLAACMYDFSGTANRKFLKALI
jgi:hypothetical protein